MSQSQRQWKHKAKAVSYLVPASPNGASFVSTVPLMSTTLRKELAIPLLSTAVRQHSISVSPLPGRNIIPVQPRPSDPSPTSCCI